MSDKNPVCPFCGVGIEGDISRGLVHPPHPICNLTGHCFTERQWNMRPRKEQPAAPVIESEVAWLRSIVRDVISVKVSEVKHGSDK